MGSVLMRSDTKELGLFVSPFSCTKEKLYQKIAERNPGRDSSPVTNTTGPQSNATSLQNFEKINFCCLSYPFYGILL